MAKAEKMQAMLLRHYQLDSIELRPNSVIETDPKTIATLEESGIVDSNKGAISYAISQGEKPITLLARNSKPFFGVAFLLCVNKKRKILWQQVILNGLDKVCMT